MDTTQFIARVVAPGGFIAVAYLPAHGGMAHRFFKDATSAAGFLSWCAHKKFECWYATASYRLASPDARGYFGGKRTQENVQALKSFWIDIDVKRKGDKKAVDKVYADIPSAATWLIKSFLVNTKLPVPNLWVHSGYGLHVYWVLEDAMTPQEWQPYAEALKAALIQNNAILDVGISADSARILRAPGTFNLKDKANPAPVTVLDKYSLGDYPNAVILQALQPYVGAVSAKAVNQTNVNTLVGSPPAVFAGRQSTTNEAAKQGTTSRRPHYFATIAERCEQVKTSLANNGNGDTYPLWYLGHLSLASFCEDGQEFIHEIGKGDPRYDAAKTEAAFLQVEKEHKAKGTGAPTCAHYERARPGVCQGCAFSGSVSSPFTLGVDDSDSDLPDNYQRNGDIIERARFTDKGEPDHVPVIGGNVYNPILDKVGENRKLTFTYERAGTKSTVAVLQTAVPVDGKTAMSFFGDQGISGIYTHNAQELGRFIVAWIEKLRDMRVERDDPVPPFGWVHNHHGSYNGFSVGGMCYRSDGTEEPAPGGDPKILAWYKPRGTLDKWKAACDFVIKDRPDLQVLVAAAFAAPLIEFTGHYGFIMSAWSRDSAVGKSSALTIGTTVWADPKAMFHLKDTANSIVYRIGHTKITPAFWDEIQLDRDQEDSFVDTLFMLGQGKEKARLNADSTLKESGDWKTILVTTGNRPLMDYVVKRRSDTDAGAVRLFEFLMEHPQLQLNVTAQQTIASAGQNAGNAGKAYAAWLAKYPDVAHAMVTKQQQKLEQELGAMQPERFFVAGMACLLVGAAVARTLNIASFDTSAMRDFLKQAFYRLREDRNTNLPVAQGFFDIERVFADFVSDHAAERLVTESFPRPGPNQPKINVTWLPRKSQGRLAIHIGRAEQRMRIDRTVWRTWCYNHGFSPSDTLTIMEKRWGAKQTRGVLGGGTDYSTGRVDILDIPLTAPELAAYNYSYDSQRKH
jgi:hypothetical protein